MNYSFEEFKAWLEEDPNRKENLNWKTNLNNWTYSPEDFKKFVKAVTNPVRNEAYTGDSYKPFREVFKKFIESIRREREREREEPRHA